MQIKNLSDLEQVMIMMREHQVPSLRIGDVEIGIPDIGHFNRDDSTMADKEYDGRGNAVGRDSRDPFDEDDMYPGGAAPRLVDE